MSTFDKDDYERKMAEKRERLASLYARLDGPPGMISVGPGWFDLVVDLDAKLAEIDPDYTIGQVKEKMGGLRFYASSAVDFDGDFRDSPFMLAIREAEGLSYRTCEDCGAPGKECGGGWTIVLCGACEAKRDGDRRIK